MFIIKRTFTTLPKTAVRKPQLNQVSDVMIPGQYLRYFKPKKAQRTVDSTQREAWHHDPSRVSKHKKEPILNLILAFLYGSIWNSIRKQHDPFMKAMPHQQLPKNDWRNGSIELSPLCIPLKIYPLC
jgi:hypothetical protein